MVSEAELENSTQNSLSSTFDFIIIIIYFVKLTSFLATSVFQKSENYET